MHSARMLIDVVVRAARILQAQPGYTMPLFRLHAQLVSELGPEAGSYAQIYQQLKKRTDSFALLDTPRLLSGTDTWPGLLREAYDSVLERTGLGSCVRITLTETEQPQDSCDLMAALSVTLGELAARCSEDQALSAYVAAGNEQLTELHQAISAGIARPTTPLPNPPP
jgi:hypothetical protein